MKDKNFPAWLQKQLDNRNWRPTDLAKKARLSDTAISRILRGQRKPDTDTLIAIAKAFHISPINIFREAGILPPGPEKEATFEDWKDILNELSPEDKNELREIAILKIKRKKE